MSKTKCNLFRCKTIRQANLNNLIPKLDVYCVFIFQTNFPKQLAKVCQQLLEVFLLTACYDNDVVVSDSNHISVDFVYVCICICVCAGATHARVSANKNMKMGVGGHHVHYFLPMKT